jgi:DNA adenine methylase
MKKLNAPIKYFGGKGTMYNKIIQYFPKPEEYELYIEPFGGSYSIGLYLDPVPPMEIYNDLDKNVFSLYKVLSDPELFRLFKERCDLAIYSEDFRNEYRKQLKVEEDIVSRAFYFFYVNRTSHNGVGGFSSNLCIRRNMSKGVSDFLSSIDRLGDLHNRLSKVIVRNTDGIDLIKKYNSPKTLIYCDPPYEQSTRTEARYKVDMDRKDHEDFIDAVIQSKSKIVISGYHCDLYDKLIKNGFNMKTFEVKTISGTFKKKTKTETLYFNY